MPLAEDPPRRELLAAGQWFPSAFFDVRRPTPRPTDQSARCERRRHRGAEISERTVNASAGVARVVVARDTSVRRQRGAEEEERSRRQQKKNSGPPRA